MSLGEISRNGGSFPKIGAEMITAVDASAPKSIARTASPEIPMARLDGLFPCCFHRVQGVAPAFGLSSHLSTPKMSAMNESAALPPDSPETASTPEAIEPRYGGFWIRVGAFLIDFIIVLPFSIGALFLGNAALYVLIAIAFTLYKPIFEATLSATPGKMVLGLKVLSKDLNPFGWSTSFIRSALFLLPGVVSVLTQYKQKVAGIGAFDLEAQQAFQQANMGLTVLGWVLTGVMVVAGIVVAFTARKRGLHDMLADTVVVYKETLPRP